MQLSSKLFYRVCYSQKSVFQRQSSIFSWLQCRFGISTKCFWIPKHETDFVSEADSSHISFGKTQNIRSPYGSFYTSHRTERNDDSLSDLDKAQNFCFHVAICNLKRNVSCHLYNNFSRSCINISIIKFVWRLCRYACSRSSSTGH